jgi:hypothetical protein
MNIILCIYPGQPFGEYTYLYLNVELIYMPRNKKKSRKVRVETLPLLKKPNTFTRKSKKGLYDVVPVSTSNKTTSSNNPYKCTQKSTQYNTDNGVYSMSVYTCTCNGIDCLGSSNTNNLFADLMGGGDISKLEMSEATSRYIKKTNKNKQIPVVDPSDTPNMDKTPLLHINRLLSKIHSKKASHKSTLKEPTISDKVPTTTLIRSEPTHQSNPYTSIHRKIRIDPTRITHRHCSISATDTEPFDFHDKINWSDTKKEPWVDQIIGEDIPKDQLAMYKNVHLGQRKLLLSEIQVLLKYYEISPDIHPVMLYIGAAIGTHLVTLSKLFPHVKFILYDGSKIYKKLHSFPNFEIHDSTTPINALDKGDTDSVNDGFFTTKKCMRWANKLDNNSLIFVSDIRLTEDDFEGGVLRDLKLQETWVHILKPKLSLLKFRPPYQAKNISYLPGDIFYGIWPPPLSAETRLLVTQKDAIKKSTKQYSFSDYEGLLYYHNKNRRTTCQSIIPKIFAPYITIKNNIYCSCYDCIAELHVLYKYSIMFDKPLHSVVRIFGLGMNKNKTLSFQTKHIE